MFDRIWIRLASVSVLGFLLLSRISIGAEDTCDMKSSSYEKQYQNIVLRASDIANLRIVKTHASRWAVGMNENGKPREVASLGQEIEFPNTQLKGWIEYARLADSKAADQLVRFHIKNVATIFVQDSWFEGDETKLFDDIWFSHKAPSAAILFRRDKLCVLIGCHGGKAAKRREVAMALAKRVLVKVSSEREKARKQEAEDCTLRQK